MHQKEGYVYIMDVGMLSSMRTEQIVTVAGLCSLVQTDDLTTSYKDLGYKSGDKDYVKLSRLVKSGHLLKHSGRLLVNPSLMITRNVTISLKDRKKFTKEYGTKFHPTAGYPLQYSLVLSVQALAYVAKFTKKQRSALFDILQLLDSDNIASLPRLQYLKESKREYKYVIDYLISLGLVKVIGKLDYSKQSTIFISPLLCIKSFGNAEVISSVYDEPCSSVDDIRTLIKKEKKNAKFI